MAQMNGLLLVDKPIGLTSHDVVQAVRRLTGIREIGHAGTLDPLASGLLVLMVGEATKLSDYVLMNDKTYQVTVGFGRATDTLDSTGQVVREAPLPVSPEAIRAAARQAQGVLELPVPAFSAVKRNGKKLYESARQGEPVDLPEREMEFRLEKVGEVTLEQADFVISCTKGSYVRSWAAHLGQQLGSAGLVKALRRLRSEPFGVQKALTLEALRAEWSEKGNLFGPAFVTMSDALPQWKALVVQGRDEKLLLNGQISHEIDRRLIVEQKSASARGEVVDVKVLRAGTGDLISILAAYPYKGLKIKRVFRASAGPNP